ncbi:MAG: ankyrin repeat domain-containing protein, partial [Spirochaetales bacterium]|nr:ankyrin repeat domain-containing protein [Spirochaetales bacterium]
MKIKYLITSCLLFFLFLTCSNHKDVLSGPQNNHQGSGRETESINKNPNDLEIESVKSGDTDLSSSNNQKNPGDNELDEPDFSEDEKNKMDRLYNTLRDKKYDQFIALVNQYKEEDFFTDPSSSFGARLLGMAIVSNIPIEILKIFSTINANYTLEDEFEWTPLARIIARDDISIFKLFEAKILPEKTDPDNLSPLHLAVKNDGIDISTYLLEQGAKQNIKEKYGRTPIYFAGLVGNYTIAKLLLDNYKEGNKTAYINKPDIFGDTPLIKAVQTRKELLVRLLLDEGADPDILGRAHRTAYFYSMTLGFDKISEMLLEKMTGSPEYYNDKIEDLKIDDRNSKYPVSPPSGSF